MAEDKKLDDLYVLEATTGKETPEELLDLGNRWRTGKGVGRKDFEMAVKYFQLAADRGLSRAQYNLACSYSIGEGVDKDLKKAAEYLRLAAEQGLDIAQYNLGHCYFNGRGIDSDIKKAVKYFRLAAEQKVSNAQYMLGYCYVTGQGVEKDPKKAVEYYQLAATQGHPDTYYDLGLCYEKGDGVKQDYNKAAEFYQLGANRPGRFQFRCQNNLGNLYYKGLGVQQDFTKAVQYFSLATEKNYYAAYYNLGVCYEQGNGVEKNEQEALRYYRKSIDANTENPDDKDAEKRMENLITKLFGPITVTFRLNQAQSIQNSAPEPASENLLYERTKNLIYTEVFKKMEERERLDHQKEAGSNLSSPFNPVFQPNYQALPENERENDQKSAISYQDPAYQDPPVYQKK